MWWNIIEGIAALCIIVGTIIGIVTSENLRRIVVRHPTSATLGLLFLGAVAGAIFINITKDGGAPLPPEVSGTYEWQWAGENWYGRLNLEEVDGHGLISKATAGLIYKDVKQNGKDEIGISNRVLELDPYGGDSTFTVTQDGIDIELFVNKPNRRIGNSMNERISGSLQETICYSGTVEYSSDEGRYKGDIVLVKGVSSNLGPLVDDFFLNPQNYPWAYAKSETNP